MDHLYYCSISKSLAHYARRRTNPEHKDGPCPKQLTIYCVITDHVHLESWFSTAHGMLLSLARKTLDASLPSLLLDALKWSNQ